MRYTVIIYVMLLTFLFFTCKRNASDSEITKNYVSDLYIRYLEAERNLKATASFFEKQDEEKYKPWRPKENVLFQASPMEERNIQKDTYRYLAESFGLSFLPPYQFSFQDEKGSTQQVKLQMGAIHSLSIEAPPSKRDGIRLTIEGGQLEATESLVFLFSDAANKAYSHTILGPYHQNTFFLSPTIIGDWPSGSGQLYVVKKQLKSSKSANWTFQTQIEFYSKTLIIEVLE